MANAEETVKDLNEKKMQAVASEREILDRVRDEKRELTADEKTALDKIDADILNIEATRDAFLRSETATREVDNVNEEFRRVADTTNQVDDARQKEEAAIRDFFTAPYDSGRRAGLNVDITYAARAHQLYRQGLRGEEFRAGLFGDTGASGGSLTVPTTVASQIYAFMTAQVALRRMNTTILTTNSGNPLSFPRVATHGIATLVANQDTAFAGTDPVLGQMTLNAYDFGELIAVGNDLLEDSGSDIIGFVTKQLGRAIGQVTATEYVTGSGTNRPNGVMTAVGGAGTVATGGSLILGTTGQQVEKLIDLVYSVVDSYRSGGPAEWLMRDLTGATIRKLRDGAGGTVGQFIWQPSPTVGMIGGQPDTLLGYNVFFDPNVASMASDAKIIAFGDFSAYYIRDTRGLRIERSDDFLFNKNQVAFRGLLRTDGDLIDSAAINVLHQAVS